MTGQVMKKAMVILSWEPRNMSVKPYTSNSSSSFFASPSKSFFAAITSGDRDTPFLLAAFSSTFVTWETLPWEIRYLGDSGRRNQERQVTSMKMETASWNTCQRWNLEYLKLSKAPGTCSSPAQSSQSQSATSPPWQTEYLVIWEFFLLNCDLGFRWKNNGRKTLTDHVGQESGIGDPWKSRHPLSHPAVLEAHSEGKHEGALAPGTTKHSVRRYTWSCNPDFSCRIKGARQRSTWEQHSPTCWRRKRQPGCQERTWAWPARECAWWWWWRLPSWWWLWWPCW